MISNVVYLISDCDCVSNVKYTKRLERLKINTYLNIYFAVVIGFSVASTLNVYIEMIADNIPDTSSSWVGDIFRENEKRSLRFHSNTFALTHSLNYFKQRITRVSVLQIDDVPFVIANSTYQRIQTILSSLCVEHIQMLCPLSYSICENVVDSIFQFNMTNV